MSKPYILQTWVFYPVDYLYRAHLHKNFQLPRTLGNICRRGSKFPLKRCKSRGERVNSTRAGGGPSHRIRKSSTPSPLSSSIPSHRIRNGSSPSPFSSSRQHHSYQCLYHSLHHHHLHHSPLCLQQCHQHHHSLLQLIHLC